MAPTMATEQVDVAIVGAGPAGMAAAVAARECGLSVVVLDEQGTAGGQIYRGLAAAPAARLAVLGPDYAAGHALFDAFRKSGSRHETGAAVWQVTRERQVHYVKDGASRTLQAQKVILCPGAMERPFPIPGWTLPGVMGAGGAQILLKSAGLLPQEPVVLAGCGPLLYLLAWQYLQAGVTIRALVQTTGFEDYRRAAPLLPAALRDWATLVKGMKLLASVRASNVPVFRKARELSVQGQEGACALHFTVGTRQHRIAASLILLHQGVVPNTQMTWSLRARHVWDDSQLCWVPEADGTGALPDLPGIYIAGDAGGIIGAQACAWSGRAAGLAAAGTLQPAQQAELTRLIAAVAATRRSRRFLECLYRPHEATRVPPDPVVVCRCEEVTAGELRRHVRNGCQGPNQLKTFTRCGMGPCQGRQCGLTVSELIAAERGVPVEAVGSYRIRPPLKPVTLGEMAGE
jgi:NADPH-dependent 2,4-dienoyl-CoA reductase/sulfur reductase-like enzyme